jgi:hypothetical protein
MGGSSCIRPCLIEIGCDNVDWIHLAQDRVQDRILWKEALACHEGHQTD